MKIRNYKESDYLDVKKNLIQGRIFCKYLDTEENLKNKIKEKPDSIIVAELNERVVGNIFIVEDKWVSYIFRFAVNKEYRNQGIGSKLLEFAEKRLRKKGYQFVSAFISKKDVKKFSLNKGYESEEVFQLFSKEL